MGAKPHPFRKGEKQGFLKIYASDIQLFRSLLKAVWYNACDCCSQQALQRELGRVRAILSEKREQLDKEAEIDAEHAERLENIESRILEAMSQRVWEKWDPEMGHLRWVQKYTSCIGTTMEVFVQNTC